MAIELITGRYGTAHIGSEDVRAYQAYTAGSGRYVLHGGGASIQSANDVHLNPAEILIDGAHVRITGQGEDVTLENGASSYNRVDIVALHYLMTGSGDAAVESVTLEVVKGTPSELTPSDPEMPASGSILDNVSETYVPYVRVLIQGLTPQTPEVLLPDYFNPADLSGDGEQVNPSVLVNLGSGDADTIFKAEPRPGVYGTLPASRGGTGQTSLQAARNAMGLGNTSGALPVANGGTGMTSNPSMLVNLASTNAANTFQTSPRPGVTGTLAVSHGGTGATATKHGTFDGGHYWVWGKFVTVYFYTDVNVPNSWSQVTLYTLPSSVPRPAHFVSCALAVSNQLTVAEGVVNDRGVVTVKGIGGTASGTNQKVGVLSYIGV